MAKRSSEQKKTVGRVMHEAAQRKIPGRSSMNKAQLQRALRR